MKISASILADSINPRGSRLTTALLTYPRSVHSEFMTHRAISRNAASSRAIPIEKMLAAVENDPAWSEHWGTNKPGMQAGEPIQEPELTWCKEKLNALRYEALKAVEYVSGYGLHKQVANRYLEPWGCITVIATAADWGWANFFNLRANPMADPTFQVLAYRLLAAYAASVPVDKEWNDWHIPYANEGRFEPGSVMNAVKAAVGRCTRVSYLRQDRDDPAENIALHDRMAAAVPMHASPFEHVAQAITADSNLISEMGSFRRYPWSNFDRPGDGGPSYWGQYRKLFPNEVMTTLDAAALLAAKPDWLEL